MKRQLQNSRHRLFKPNHVVVDIQPVSIPGFDKEETCTIHSLGAIGTQSETHKTCKYWLLVHQKWGGALSSSRLAVDERVTYALSWIVVRWSCANSSTSLSRLISGVYRGVRTWWWLRASTWSLHRSEHTFKTYIYWKTAVSGAVEFHIVGPGHPQLSAHH